jgi:hypothetical protein
MRSIVHPITKTVEKSLTLTNQKETPHHVSQLLIAPNRHNISGNFATYRNFDGASPISIGFVGGEFPRTPFHHTNRTLAPMT